MVEVEVEVEVEVGVVVGVVVEVGVGVGVGVVVGVEVEVEVVVGVGVGVEVEVEVGVVMQSILLTLKVERGKKTWVAAIDGKSRKFGLAREFVGCIESRQGERDYLLDQGQLYEVCEVGERSFFVFEAGEKRTLTKQEAIARIDAQEARKRAEQKKREEEINNAIVRINAEGGFSLN